jgi:multidrug efflux system outer membrane protein
MAAKRVVALVVAIAFTGCVPALKEGQKPRNVNTQTPDSWGASADQVNSSSAAWNEFFSDPNLVQLIDLALQNNQELNIAIQEIYIANNEVLSRSGDYMPFVSGGAAAGIEKVGKYTSQGANDDNTDIVPGKRVPANLANYFVGFRASWEVDIWKKLRNATKAAAYRYLASIEGRNFMITALIAEIAHLYYELMALDNQLAVLRQNIGLQQNALEIVRLEKQAARVTELAVTRFEAEVLKNQSRQFEIQQQIVEAENRINFLVGRFPQPVARNSDGFNNIQPTVVNVGLPTQLLENRPDVRQAELNLKAAELDVNVARAAFYPSLSIEAGIGYDAYTPGRLFTTPASLVYNVAGNLFAPLLNRRAIKAAYFSANSTQQQATVRYEKALLEAYTEAANQMAMINNLGSAYTLKSQQVEKLVTSIEISNVLFKSARADYLEVLTTRRDSLEAQMELIETQKRRLNAVVNVYQAIGGGWRAANDETAVTRGNTTADDNLMGAEPLSGSPAKADTNK